MVGQVTNHLCNCFWRVAAGCFWHIRFFLTCHYEMVDQGMTRTNFLYFCKLSISQYMGALTHSRLDRAVIARYYSFLVISQLVIFTLIGVIFSELSICPQVQVRLTLSRFC